MAGLGVDASISPRAPPGLLPQLNGRAGHAGDAGHAKQALRDRLIAHKAYIRQRGEDMPEVREWRWPAP